MTGPSRRHVLLVGLVLAVVLAGCTGGGGTPTATDVDGAGDGADAGGGDGGGDGESDGGDAGADGSTPASTPTATAPATATATATPNTSVATTAQLPTLGEAIEPADSFRYRFDIDRIDGRSVDFVQEGRYYEGDIFAEVTTDQGTSSVYIVDGQSYVVGGDVCQRAPAGSAQSPENTSRPNSWANLSLRPTETTTLDGEEVYVYESENGPPKIGGPTTIYVSVASGHVVRQEAPNFVSETWDFGNVDPIEVPC